MKLNVFHFFLGGDSSTERSSLFHHLVFLVGLGLICYSKPSFCIFSTETADHVDWVTTISCVSVCAIEHRENPPSTKTSEYHYRFLLGWGQSNI